MSDQRLGIGESLLVSFCFLFYRPGLIVYAGGGYYLLGRRRRRKKKRKKAL
jgi:hypothetical protein